MVIKSGERLMKKQVEPLIIAIGGGKSGVGKSMVSSNLAVQYASAGLKVVLIDLDVGAANLHTIFGIRQPPKGLGDYFTTPRSQISDYFIHTKIPNLQLVPGSGFVPESANLKHAQKLKIITQIKALSADLVLLDLGAGSSSSVIDFFSMTHAGIIVTTPEPTAIVNAYEFLKNVIYRILFRMFKNQDDILEIIRNSTLPNQSVATIEDLIKVIAKKHPWAAQTIREICQDLDFHLVFNQSRKLSDADLGKKLHAICQKFLNIDLTFSGIIFFNEEVSASVFKMCPISLAFPNSVTAETLKRIALTIFRHITDKIADNAQKPSFEDQINNSFPIFKKDFELNLLAQKKFQREREQQISQ